MKANSFLKITFLFVILFFSNFVNAQKVSHYIINEEYFEFPGKWEHKGQLKSSSQYHFVNKKTDVSLMIVVAKPEKYEFYETGLSESELLEKYYKWETDYWKTGEKVLVSELKRNSNYIIWRLFKEKVKGNIDLNSYLLFSVRNNKLTGITLNDNGEKPMSEEEKIKFLEDIFQSQNKK